MGRGSNISAMNSFEGGLVSDLHVGASPSNTVTYALNMELITSGENQYIFQNIKGQKHILDLPEFLDGAIKRRFIPLGMKISNNIAYILVGAFKEDGTFVTGGIGTFPSPVWADLNSTDEKALKTSLLKEQFSFLHNFKPINGTEATSPFITTQFNFEKNRFIDIDIQGDFDGSVNIIFTDDKNNPGIINSRFKRVDSSQMVSIADRSGTKDSNIYSEQDWDRVGLIQNANYPVSTSNADGEETFQISEGGYLRGGGYRYYFKYSTQEGNTTDILYESPLIPISNSGLGLSKEQISDKMIQFSLSNLDSSYAGIRVYFAHFDGKDAASMEIFKINYVYSYGDTDSIVISHTGLEDVTLVDVSEINVGFTPIDTITTATIISDRLALGGASATISELDIKTLTDAALSMTLWERTMVVDKSYADAETASKYLGFWKGEVYEFAVVFSLRNKGLSPAFPITGLDNILGTHVYTSNGTYPAPGIIKEGFGSNFLINNKGIYRTSLKGDIYQPLPGGKGQRFVTYIEVNCSLTSINKELAKIASGFFIVRRQRIKNVLMQGMAVPTLRLPSKYPSLPEDMARNQAGISAGRRYMLSHFPEIPTLGLNTKYKASLDWKKEESFNDDFDTVFVPQPVPLINVVTSEKSWVVAGNIGQKVSSTVYGRTVDKETGEQTNKIHLAFYSCELELNFSAIKGHLNGINPEVEVQQLFNNASPVAYTYIALKAGLPMFKSESLLIIKQAEKISTNRSLFTTFPSLNVRATIMESGRASFSKNSFTSKVDRSLGFIAKNTSELSDELTDANQRINFAQPFYGDVRRISEKTDDASVMYSNTKLYKRLQVSSLIVQSYSRYIGIEITLPLDPKETPIPAALFNFSNKLSSSSSVLPNSAGIMLDPTGAIMDRKFTNTGHLANIFRSATGRWEEKDIVNIYKYDSNKVYYAASNRFEIDKKSVSVFRGDGFISRIYKKSTFKNGIPTSKSATSADASDFGIGLLVNRKTDIKAADIHENELDDLGRGLYDVGQVIELISYSNVNADIRSVETFSPEETVLFGGDRDFYPNKQNVFGDSRPDSTGYNHGYTGDVNPVSYSRIAENSPSFNTEFPNRILLSEKNKTQGFFNAFRDLKGFNYRDYGVELGPIVKLVAVKNILLSIHPTGVLAIGVDDKTLVAEGSDVYVNTAQALSPNSKKVSDLFGASHPEAIVKTDTTVAGVDYTSSVVWVFEGDKLSVISEFAVTTILERFKASIEKGSHAPNDEKEVYRSRVYSTFNHSKHTMYISYVAENSKTREQYHVGTITYNTVLQKWMSEISEGNKFSLSIGSATYTTGFYDIKKAGIWKEDSLIDPATGKFVRVSLRGKQDYGYAFEIVLNKEPALEKVLDNIRMITNKSLPYEIVYTTTGDENDAALNIWGSDLEESELTQKIITRNNSSRNHLRLGILDENAYYKNSGLFIEVKRLTKGALKTDVHKRVRDKNIKVKFIYKGNDETFLQAIISMLSISYN